jgi:hypothetical protein
MLFVYFIEFFKFPFLAAKDLDDVHSRNMFLYESIQIGYCVPYIVKGNFDLFLEYVCTDQQQWNRGQTK